MKKKLFITLIIMMMLFSLSFNIIVNAESSDLLISVGTGNYHIEVTTTTTIDDIKKVLGEPKLTTPSAFGGEAYAFYTDDNYSNYLYIETLEDVIGMKSKKEYLPMQAGDVYQTYADVSELEKNFGFKPQTTISEGLTNFINWYRDFYHK